MNDSFQHERFLKNAEFDEICRNLVEPVFMLFFIFLYSFFSLHQNFCISYTKIFAFLHQNFCIFYTNFLHFLHQFFHTNILRNHKGENVDF